MKLISNLTIYLFLLIALSSCPDSKSGDPYEVGISVEFPPFTRETLKQFYLPYKSITLPFDVDYQSGRFPYPNDWFKPKLVDFKVFVITEAVKAGLSEGEITQAISAAWDSDDNSIPGGGTEGEYPRRSKYPREDWVGKLSQSSDYSTAPGQAWVRYTTPNRASEIFAVSMRPNGNQSVQFYKVSMISESDYLNLGLDHLPSSLNVVPTLIDDCGSQVMKTGQPFSIILEVRGLLSNEPGSSYQFEITSKVNGSSQVGPSDDLPSGIVSCQFWNDYCVIPLKPINVAEPGLLNLTLRPVDKRLPLKPASMDLKLILNSP